MTLRTVVLGAALLAVACREDVSFPAAPPRPAARWRELDRHVRERAGKGAIDCGVSRDSASGPAVHACASRALRARQPFFCRYDPRPVVADPFGRSSRIGVNFPPGAAANAPTAYIGTRDGVVFALKPLADGGVATWQALSPADRNGKPKRLDLPLTPPRLLRGGSIRTGKDQISGIVIVEATINDRGTVSDAHVIKRLPQGLDIQALELVKQASFEPARFFGVPHAVVYNVTVKVERGVIALP